MTDNIKHFEQLYVEAEELSSETYKDKSTSDLLEDISSICLAMKSVLDSSANEGIKSSLKNRFIGELLFMVTAITSKGDIDSFKELNTQIQINKIIV